MVIALFPFKYYAVLPDSTLTTKIREESWKLDKLFPLIKESKKELKKLGKSIKSSPSNILKLQHSIAVLAAEIRTGMKDLKLINFYDSTIFYLYYKLLKHVLDLCKKKRIRLIQKTKEVLSKEIKFKDQKLENIKKEKEGIERNIKDYEKKIKKLDLDEKELVKVYQRLVKKLRKLRWKTEKQAQQEFLFSKFTFRSMENLNRKIKVIAIKVKKTIPQKTLLMRRIQTKVSYEDIIMLSKLTSKAIDNVSKDVLYSSKLVSQMEKELKRLKAIVENLKKAITKLLKNKKISEETAKKITKPWYDAINYVDEQIHKDLMQIFRNIFIEYKYIGTRKLEVPQQELAIYKKAA
jgi:chromosome segregation protein